MLVRGRPVPVRDVRRQPQGLPLAGVAEVAHEPFSGGQPAAVAGARGHFGVLWGSSDKATYNPQKVFRPKIKPGGRRVRRANATDRLFYQQNLKPSDLLHYMKTVLPFLGLLGGAGLSGWVECLNWAKQPLTG